MKQAALERPLRRRFGLVAGFDRLGYLSPRISEGSGSAKSDNGDASNTSVMYAALPSVADVRQRLLQVLQRLK